MTADKRLFRVTKYGYGGSTTVSYKNRQGVSGVVGQRRDSILKIEAVDEDAIPWTDVTAEFASRPRPTCRFHPKYTGQRKPALAKWSKNAAIRYFRDCTCWATYCSTHPNYPAHSESCTVKQTDPADCECRMLHKMLE